MIPVVVATAGALSVGLLGYSLNEYAKYRQFIKNKNDGDYLLVDGPISSEPPDDLQNSIYYKILVEKGQKKTAVRIVTRSDGRRNISFPETYTYTDYSTIFEKQFMANNLRIGKIGL